MGKTEIKGAGKKISESLKNLKFKRQTFLILIGIVVVLIIVVGIGILLYLLWPTGEGFHPQKGWQEPKKEASTINKILQKLKRKREEQKYEFKT